METIKIYKGKLSEIIELMKEEIENEKRETEENEYMVDDKEH